jgi:hypothetical protein
VRSAIGWSGRGGVKVSAAVWTSPVVVPDILG